MLRCVFFQASLGLLRQIILADIDEYSACFHAAVLRRQHFVFAFCRSRAASHAIPIVAGLFHAGYISLSPHAEL